VLGKVSPQSLDVKLTHPPQVVRAALVLVLGGCSDPGHGGISFKIWFVPCRSGSPRTVAGDRSTEVTIRTGTARKGNPAIVAVRKQITLQPPPRSRRALLASAGRRFETACPPAYPPSRYVGEKLDKGTTSGGCGSDEMPRRSDSPSRQRDAIGTPELDAFYRGRDDHCWPPPAQIRAGAANARTLPSVP
jgi:hypothetical protein